MKKLALFLPFIALPGLGQEAKPPSSIIEGVKGVKQEAAPIESIEKIEGTKMPAPVPAPNAVQPVAPPPPPKAAATAVNQIDGIKTPATNAVKAVPPPPLGSAVANIRPVKGITGIVIPKQKNLEAALQIQTGGGTPNAKAAAQLGGPGEKPGPPQPGGDGRAAFQEFEKNAAGS